MSDKRCRRQARLNQSVITHEYVNRIIKERDSIIRAQIKRIEQLEHEVEKVRKERDIFSTKVTLLTYKLQLNSPKSADPPSER